MKSRFTILPGNPPAPARSARFVPAPTRTEAIARPQVVTYLNTHTAARKPTAAAKSAKPLGSGWGAQRLFKTTPIRKSDPYLLLLLADQELDEGREEQARYLVEAAYEAYDQQTEPCVYRIRP